MFNFCLVFGENDQLVSSYPDLNLNVEDIEDDDQSIHLKAFKSQENDKIIQLNKTEDFKYLKWYSFGNPTLIETRTRNKKRNEDLFHLTQEGFYTYIQMLTDKQRNLFTQSVKRTYKIDVDTKQIENLVLTSFICKILLNDTKKIELVGEVTSLLNFPLRLDFDYQKGTKERDLFDKRYSKSNQSPLKLTCQVSSNQYNKNISFLTENHLVKESTKIVSLGILFKM